MLANDDSLVGNLTANFIQVGDGDDIVGSGEGNDTIYGGTGEDELWRFWNR